MNGFGNDDARQERWERRRLRLGSPHPHCAVCGMDNLQALCRTRKTAARPSRVSGISVQRTRRSAVTRQRDSPS